MTDPAPLAAVPATPVLSVTPANETAAQALDRWLATSVRDTAYARNTAAWNEIHAAYRQILSALARVDNQQGGL